MKIELLPSTVGCSGSGQYGTTILIDEIIAVDAGTLGLMRPLERQERIEHVVLTHAHIDHIASLPVFLDNMSGRMPSVPTVHAGTETLDILKRHIFNDQIWPDFLRLPTPQQPLLKLNALQPETAVSLAHVTMTPVPLHHTTPVLGYVADDGQSAAAFVFDTGPTERIWERLADCTRLRIVFLECSFPDRQRALAEASGHLCPELFAQELKKLRPDVRVIACHLKPPFFDEICCELSRIDSHPVEIARPGQPYRC